MARRWLLIAAFLCGCGEATTETPADGDAAADALPPEEDATTPLDAAPADAADAGADAKDAGPGGDGAVFTDDFGDGDLTDDWEVANVCAGCSATLDQGAFVAKTKSVASQETAFAHLRSTVPGAPSRVRLSFLATFPVTTLTKGTLAIATVDVSTSHFFSVYLRDGDMAAPGPVLEETTTAGTTRHVLAGVPPAGAATRIVVDLDLGAGLANVAWGNAVALANEPIAKTPPANDPTIRVGLLYVFGPQDAFEARFDDVLLEYY